MPRKCPLEGWENSFVRTEGPPITDPKKVWASRGVRSPLKKGYFLPEKHHIRGRKEENGFRLFPEIMFEGLEQQFELLIRTRKRENREVLSKTISFWGGSLIEEERGIYYWGGKKNSVESDLGG